MSIKNVITRELIESMKHVLGRNIKVSFKTMVRMETKPDKTENRVLAFSSCRFFIFTAKVPTKIEHTFHYLDIQSLESKKPNQLCLTIENKVYTFYSMEPDSDDVDRMISQLGTAIKTVFPQVPLEHVIRKFEVLPMSRLQDMLDYNQNLEEKDAGPCGGYSTQYACMTSYHGLPYREEVAWDVDTIYLSHDSKELSLLDFDHLDGRDLVPILSALRHNAWFTSFRASNIKLSAEALEQLLIVMKKTVSIEEFYLDNTGIKWDFAHKLSMALLANPNPPLHTLDLSNNLIEDKGVNSLCGIIAKIAQGTGHLSGTIGKLHRGLIHLNLSKTGLTSKGVNALAHALSLNRSMPSTLTYLNLSDNVFKEDINNLYNFLAQPNALTHLDLSGTECALDTVFGALLRGCTQKLTHLNLSRNLFTTKKSKDVIVPPSFKTFFSSTVALKHLNVSQIKLPAEALKAMLLGLACNEIATDVCLDLSSNELRSQGAGVLESCLAGIRCLCSLDISDNGFDSDLANIVSSVGKNKSLKHLYIGRNFTNIKPKHLGRVLDSIVQLIQEEDSVLETLSLADSKLRGETCLILNALGSNQCLTSIDITGNYMGAGGAKTLAKALQINTKLRSILWDKNNITVQGFMDIAYALEKNFTLRYMSCPINDATTAMKISPDKTETALKRIEELLHRNVTPQKFNNGQAFRLQQSFLMSSTQQMVDRWMVHLQETINTVKRSLEEETSSLDELEQAEGYLKDANNSKQLLARLHNVVLELEEGGNPVELKLQDFVDELNTTIQSYIELTATCMVECLEEQCPNIMADEKFHYSIKNLCSDRGNIPQDLVRHSILDQAGADIMNKISEVNLSVAAHVSDRLVDEVIDSLTRSHRELSDRMSQERSTTPDVLRGRSRGDGGLRSSRSKDSQLDRDSFSECSESPLATPKLPNKRKSVHTRKLRPQSVVGTVQGMPADDFPDLLPKDAEDSLPSLSPTSDKLEHLGKARPKRPKTRAPTRPCIPSQEMQDLQNLGEGLDIFFKYNPNSPPSVSPDSEDIRPRTDSNSTTASGSVSLTETLSVENNTKVVEKSPEKEPEKRGIMKGLTSLFSRGTKDESLLKPRSCESIDRVNSNENTPIHKAPKENSTTREEKFRSAPQLRVPNGQDEKNCEETGDAKLTASSPKIEKLGVGITPGNVLAEMKARQEKRVSGAPLILHSKQLEEKSICESKEANLLQAVKLKPTGLAEALRSPTDYVVSDSSPNSGKEDSLGDRNSSVRSSGGKLSSSPVSSYCTPPGGSPRLGENSASNHFLAGIKGKPPPLVPPKPRPKSVISMLDSRLSGDFSPPEDFSTTEEISKSVDVMSELNVVTKESTSRIRSIYQSKGTSTTIQANGNKNFPATDSSSSSSSVLRWSRTNKDMAQRTSLQPGTSQRSHPPTEQHGDDIVDV